MCYFNSVIWDAYLRYQMDLIEESKAHGNIPFFFQKKKKKKKTSFQININTF